MRELSKTIKVNVYLKDKTNLVENFEIPINEDINSIDMARLISTRYLDPIYNDIEYRTSIFKPLEGDNEINLVFEDNTRLKREFKLEKILNK